MSRKTSNQRDPPGRSGSRRPGPCTDTADGPPSGGRVAPRCPGRSATEYGSLLCPVAPASLATRLRRLLRGTALSCVACGSDPHGEGPASGISCTCRPRRTPVLGVGVAPDTPSRRFAPFAASTRSPLSMAVHPSDDVVDGHVFRRDGDFDGFAVMAAVRLHARGSTPSCAKGSEESAIESFGPQRQQ